MLTDPRRSLVKTNLGGVLENLDSPSDGWAAPKLLMTSPNCLTVIHNPENGGKQGVIYLQYQFGGEKISKDGEQEIQQCHEKIGWTWLALIPEQAIDLRLNRVDQYQGKLVLPVFVYLRFFVYSLRLLGSTGELSRRFRKLGFVALQAPIQESCEQDLYFLITLRGCVYELNEVYKILTYLEAILLGQRWCIKDTSYLLKIL